MNSLQVLKNTLKKLNKREVTSLIALLNAYRKDAKEQSIQLVELLLRKKNYSSNQLQLILYGKANYHAFNKLIIRLKERLHEILIIDSNLLRSDQYGLRNRTVFEIKKKILQCEVLRARGMKDEIEFILNKIINLSKEFELYEYVVACLKIKQRVNGFRFGSPGFLSVKNEIDKYSEYYEIIIRAREQYGQITSKINFSGNDIYNTELEIILEKLNNDFIKTNSATIKFYYLFLKTQYFQSLYRFKDARQILEMNFNMVRNNQAVFTFQRLGVLSMNISINEILLFNFEIALKRADEVFILLGSDFQNIQLGYEVKYYAYFYLNKLDDAEKLIKELYHASRSSNTPFFYSKRAFLFACCKTISGKYEESLELLKEAKEIEKDKTGWYVGVRLLHVINLVELEKYDAADRQIEKMERQLAINEISEVIRKRDHVILKILLELMKFGYDFKKVLNKKQLSFNLLESNDLDLVWNVYGYELILFPEWFRCKAESRPYDHATAVQNEKWKFISRQKLIEK
ncbi:MAG: hypothetical protein NT126_09980 [Bacteroidetes bacterium]|nr:hypothetical protein [Bacteroidota bacterium]